MTVFKDSSSKVIKIFSTFTALVFSCTFYGVSVMMDVLRDTIQAPNSAYFIPALFSRKASLTASLSIVYFASFKIFAIYKFNLEKFR